MGDYCLRGLALNDEVRFFVLSGGEICEDARKRHDTLPIATAALGRTLMVNCMLALDLKVNGSISVEFNGDGPLGKIKTKCNNLGEVKGYVENPQVDLPLKANGKIDVSSGVGFGTMTVIRDEEFKKSFKSSIPIVSGEIGEDFTEYFYSSEQIFSGVGVGVLVDRDYSVKSAGGFIFQLMPNVSKDMGIELEDSLKLIKNLSLFFYENKPEDFLKLIFNDDYKILKREEVKFFCECSREDYKKSLITLGRKTLENLSENRDGLEIICEYCNEKYIISRDEVLALIESI